MFNFFPPPLFSKCDAVVQMATAELSELQPVFQNADNQSAPPLSLDDCLQLAFKNRGAIASAGYALQGINLDRRASGTYPMMHLEAADGTRPDVNGGEDLTLFQPLDVFNIAGANRKIGNADLEGAQSQLNQTKLDVQTQVVNRFAESLAAQETANLAKLQLSLAQKLLEITQGRVTERSAPAIDVDRVQIVVAQAQLNQTSAQAAVDAANLRLSGVLGVAEAPTEVKSTAYRLNPSDSGFDLSKKPSLLAILATAKHARAEANVARKSNLPTAELQARRTPWTDPERYGVRIQLVIPLFDWGAAKDRANAANDRAKAADALYQDTLAIATKEANAAFKEYQAGVTALESAKSVSKLASDVFTKSQKAFQLGAISLVEVLDAEQAYIGALTSLVSAQLSLGHAYANYLDSTGTILLRGAPQQ